MIREQGTNTPTEQRDKRLQLSVVTRKHSWGEVCIDPGTHPFLFPSHTENCVLTLYLAMWTRSNSLPTLTGVETPVPITISSSSKNQCYCERGGAKYLVCTHFSLTAVTFNATGFHAESIWRGKAWDRRNVFNYTTVYRTPRLYFLKLCNWLQGTELPRWQHPPLELPS